MDRAAGAAGTRAAVLSAAARPFASGRQSASGQERETNQDKRGARRHDPRMSNRRASAEPQTSIRSVSEVLGRAAEREVLQLFARGRAAKCELLKLFALAPVRRGKGKGEGSAA